MIGPVAVAVGFTSGALAVLPRPLPKPPHQPTAEAIGRRCKRILPLRLGDLKNRDIVLPVAGYSKLVTSSSLKPDNHQVRGGQSLYSASICSWQPARLSLACSPERRPPMYWRKSIIYVFTVLLPALMVGISNFHVFPDASLLATLMLVVTVRRRRRLHLRQRRRDGEGAAILHPGRCGDLRDPLRQPRRPLDIGARGLGGPARRRGTP